MALVYSSLGIHRTIAVLVVLAFRGLNFWLPMLTGLLPSPEGEDFWAKKGSLSQKAFRG